MSSLLNNILSSIDPTAASRSPATNSRQTEAKTVPRPPPRPAPTANGVPQAQPLKRKAEGESLGGQNKIQRKDDPAQTGRTNDSVRPAPPSDGVKPKNTAPAISVPYRGTAGLGGLGGAKALKMVVNKASGSGGAQSATYKPAAPAPRLSAGTTPPPTASAASSKKSSYAAMLARAKEVQSAKPPTPPVKHEPTKILTKKERLALREEAKAGAKGKKFAAVGPPSKSAADAKGDIAKEKRKPVGAGYQGTARPAKKPVDLGYKGTARPATAVPGGTGRDAGSSAARPKPKTTQSKYDGYAPWSDISGDEEEEEEDYDSDASSDMEGGVWDVEQEEQAALKAARQEDLEALREENELKRQKEERRKKLAALAAATKKKY